MVQFNQPIWLVLFIPAAALIVWWGRKSLSGMGTWARRTALLVRLLVVALIVGALADPHWRREAKNVAVNFIVDVSRSATGTTQVQNNIAAYALAAGRRAEEGDLISFLTVAREAYLQMLPRPVGSEFDVNNYGDPTGTNLESGVRLAMAVLPQMAANRLVLVSDANQTAGSVIAAAQAAKAAKIPIDVYPIEYAYEREVIVERLIAPATARQGEIVSLRAVLTATKRTRGRLNLFLNDEPIDLDPDGPSVGMEIDVAAGTEPYVVPVKIPGTGPQRFSAVFEPFRNSDGSVGDTISENNRALAVTFVGGEGRLLVLTTKPEEAQSLMRALREARIRSELKDPSSITSLADLGAYEGVALVNCSSYEFTQQQQEELRSYVHDLGGGLVKIGGPESFGAGGWIGSPLADALPIKLDPPQKRQMPRGALALVMHACELPNGNYWGRRCAEAAIDALSSRDMAGIVESGWEMGSATWTHPLSELGDKSQIRRSIRNMNYGDSMSFADMLAEALASLQKANAGQKHVIIVSDGDPQPPTDAQLQQFIASRITISCVGVGMHRNPADLQKMRRIAQITGGNFHEIDPGGKMDALPQFFVKEAQTVRRSLIWEGEPFSPKISGGQLDTLRGIAGVPPIKGYVVAAEREGLATVTLRGQENDPVMAQWQYGLGRCVTFTSDATGRWATAWPEWSGFRQFWEQTMRWAMRPPGSPNMRVVTEERGDKTRVIVEAVDDKGERLDFLRWRGRVVRPDLTASSVELVQNGPGRYEATIDTVQSGSHTLSLGYEESLPDGTVRQGSVQAAITKPFSDEFRALRSNRALLEQVARLTGGRVLERDPRLDNLWTREGLTMPVSLQPIWLAVTLVGIGLFLMDVAIRRVRIDVPGIWKATIGLFARSRQKAGEQVENLKAARERARQRMVEASRVSDQRAEAGGGGGAGASVPMAPTSEATRKVKFEASAEELRAAKGQSAVSPIEPSRVVEKKKQPDKPAEPGEAGMSRLLKAKKRAQDEMSDE